MLHVSFLQDVYARCFVYISVLFCPASASDLGVFVLQMLYHGTFWGLLDLSYAGLCQARSDMNEYCILGLVSLKRPPLDVRSYRSLPKRLLFLSCCLVYMTYNVRGPA